MGRVSKRGNSLRKTAGIHSEQNVKVRRYRAGIYARLSADHDERKNESVEVQIEIARKYIEEFNLKNTEEIIDIIDCYTDLGKTGSNFEREGFLRLLYKAWRDKLRHSKRFVKVWQELPGGGKLH